MRLTALRVTQARRLQMLMFIRCAVVSVASGLLLAACVTPQLPTSGEAVEILDLHCNADRTVAAVALRRTPGISLGTGGVLLYSSDAGLTWSVTTSLDQLRDVTPRFFTDPRDGLAAVRPLVVAGYKSSGLLEWTYQLGGWMQSKDQGRTWEAIPARLPAVGSRDPVGRPPAIIEVDATGRLATVRRAPSPALLISDDQGATWRETRPPQIDFSVFHVRGDGRGRLIVLGRSEPKIFQPDRLVVVRSDDSGNTWSVAMSEPADHFGCNPRMIGSVDGAMLVYNPCPEYGKRYYFSIDGGRTWQARVFFRYAFGALELATVVEGNRWVALSREGEGRRSLVAWISDNGGAEWRSQRTGYAITAGDARLAEQSIMALPGGVVLAYVGDGQVLRSADRGETWQIVDTGLPRKGTYLLGASCTDGNRLVVLGGGQGMLVRSTDAGLTWQTGRLPRMGP